MPSLPYRLRLLGRPELLNVYDTPVDLPLGKPFAVLIYLALSPSPPSREELGCLLWADSDAPRAKNSIRNALHTLRGVLDLDSRHLGDPVELPATLIETDIGEFERCLSEGELQAAIALWRGPMLNGFSVRGAAAWHDWADRYRIPLVERFTGLLLTEADSRCEAGDPESALPYLAKAIEVQPYRLDHHLRFARGLLDLRRFDAAEATIATARPYVDSDAAARELAKLRERLQTLRRGAMPGGARSAIRSEFTDRAEEFARLTQHWRRAQSGNGSVAVIAGPKGIGKSRLAAELGNYARSEGGEIVHIRAVESSRPMAWGVLTELVRSLYRMRGAAGINEPCRVLLHKLVPSLSPPDSRSEFSRVGVSASRAAQVADALGDLIDAVSGEAPLLVIIDDLQWVDRMSRSVLVQVAPRLTETHCALVLTCRGECGGPSVAETLSAVTRGEFDSCVDLQPLRGERIDELLDFLSVRSDSADVARLSNLVHGSAEGLPGRVVEILETLHRDGAIEIDASGNAKLLGDKLNRELDNFQPPAALVETAPLSAEERREPTRSGFKLALLFILLLVGVWTAVRELDPAATTPGDQHRIAVFPFQVRGAPELEYLGPGMTTLLSASFDGAGGMSSVSPPRLLQSLRDPGLDRQDPGGIARHARQLGANGYVTGEVVAADGRLRIHARWYGTDGRGDIRTETTVEGDVDEIFTLADHIAAELWAEQIGSTAESIASSAGRTTRSLAALETFLEGERYFRAGNYPAAVTSFQHALAIDSTFGFAAYRLGTVAEWVGNWPLASEARERAVRFSSRLPSRERLLTEALNAAREHDPTEALRLYDGILKDVPDDIEALFWSAQTRYRLGALVGIAPHDAYPAFEQVLRLDSTHVPALLHLVQAAAWAGDSLALDSLRGPIKAAFPGDPLPWIHLMALGSSYADVPAELGIAYDTLDDALLWRLAEDAALYTRDRTSSARLAEKLTSPARGSEARVAGHLLLSFLRMSQGRIEAANRNLSEVASMDTAAYLEYRALFATPHFLPIHHDSVRAIRDAVGAWEGTGTENPYLPLWSDMYPPVAEYLLGVLSARIGDADAVEHQIATLDSLEVSPLGTRLNTMRINAIRARSAAQRGNARVAWALLAQTEFPGLAVSTPRLNHYQRNLRPYLLRTLGRSDKALGYFSALPWRGSYYQEQALWDMIHRAPFHFERAKILEDLGREVEAADHFARVIELWSDADPELQPQVQEARARLARLDEPR